MYPTHTGNLIQLPCFHCDFNHDKFQFRHSRRHSPIPLWKIKRFETQMLAEIVSRIWLFDLTFELLKVSPIWQVLKLIFLFPSAVPRKKKLGEVGFAMFSPIHYYLWRERKKGNNRFLRILQFSYFCSLFVKLVKNMFWKMGSNLQRLIRLNLSATLRRGIKWPYFSISLHWIEMMSQIWGLSVFRRIEMYTEWQVSILLGFLSRGVAWRISIKAQRG